VLPRVRAVVATGGLGTVTRAACAGLPAVLVPDESTVRKLTRRLGPELVDDLTREVVRLAIRERGFRVRAMRCDSTVQEADIRFPATHHAPPGLRATGPEQADARERRPVSTPRIWSASPAGAEYPRSR